MKYFENVFRCSPIWNYVTSMKMSSIAVNGVSTVFRNIHSDERFVGTPAKEVLYLDVGIALYIFC